MDEYSVIVSNVSKIINNNKILKNISFKIKKGEIVGLIGENGAGKSTLFKVMSGLYTLDNGNIFYNNIDLKINYEKAIKNIGCVIDSPSLYKNLNAYENLKLYTSNKKEIKDLLCKVKLNNKKKVKDYSMGMKEKLALLIATINNPSILILDEPTNGLDPHGINQLNSYLKSLKDKTIIISSHILSEIESICDRVIFIKDGRIIDEKVIKMNDKKCILFSVNNYERAREILGEFCINEDICLYANDEEVNIFNKALVENNVKVYRITDRTLENEYFKKVGKDD